MLFVINRMHMIISARSFRVVTLAAKKGHTNLSFYMKVQLSWQLVASLSFNVHFLTNPLTIRLQAVELNTMLFDILRGINRYFQCQNYTLILFIKVEYFIRARVFVI